jgi:hypothetical protein
VKRLICVLLLLFMFAPVSAGAHHSLASYNTAIYMTAAGTVKSFDWSNPHVLLVLMVIDRDGAPKIWDFEGGSISRLAANGFTKTIVAPGDKIKVQYNPRRGSAPGGFFLGITTPDGRNHNIARLIVPSGG